MLAPKLGSKIVPGTDKALPENSQPNLNKRVHLWSRNGRDRVISCYSQRAGPLFGGGVVRRLTSARSGLSPDRCGGPPLRHQTALYQRPLFLTDVCPAAVAD